MVNDYRWHDLRVKPNDLPTEDGEYLTFIEYDNYKGGFCIVYEWAEGWNCWRRTDGTINRINEAKVTAWKKIEPFE